MAIIPTDFVVRGLIAARPAPGIAGRLYVVTDGGSQRVTYDDGAVWQDVHVDPPYAPGAGGGAGALTLLFHSELAVAGVFNYDPVDATFRSLLLKWIWRSDQAAVQAAFLTFNDDAAANYGWSALTGNGVGVASALDNAALGCNLGTAPGTGISANRWATGEAWIQDYASGTPDKQIDAHNLYWDGAHMAMERVGTIWLNVAAITEIDVIPAAGLFIAGSKLQIYGLS